MKTKKMIYAAVAACLMSLGACKKADPPANTPGASIGELESGIFIANEGAFGQGNGSISYFNSLGNSVRNNIFSSKNGRPLGDVVQSISKHNGRAYICVNGSNKVEVVDATTFDEITTITSGISGPRYMVASGSTGYVSCWGTGSVAVIDLNSGSVTTNVNTGSGPEGMAINNNNLYVANSGGFGVDSTLTVIDLGTNTPSIIQLNAYNPSSVVNGIGSTVWVLAKGRTLYDGNWNVIGHEPCKLIEINTNTNTIASTTTLFNEMHPAKMDISPNKTTLYIGGSYGFQAIYTVNTMNTSSLSSFIAEQNYGFFVNQNNGNLFVLQHASASNGKLLRYSPSGEKLGEYTVGVFPNGGTSKRN